MKLVEINNDKSEQIIEGLGRLGALDVKVYNMDTGCRVIYSVEGGKEHVSISHSKRYPNWNEITYVRYKLMKPNITVAQILPQREEYVNTHVNCFHLWEIEDSKISK